MNRRRVRLACAALLSVLAGPTGCALDGAGLGGESSLGDADDRDTNAGDVALWPLDDGGSIDSSLPDTATLDTATADSSDTATPDGSGPDTALPDTAVADTALPDTAVADTALPDTAVADTAVADTALPDTAVADTAVADTAPTCDESACAVVPTSAQRVALVDRTSACPAGWTSTDVVQAKAGDGCACSCVLTTSPTCPANVNMATSYSDTAGCGSTGAVIKPSGSGVCTNLGFSGNLRAYFSATPPGPAGGAATATVGTDPAAISRPRRLCVPPAGSCSAAACASPFTECVEGSATCGGAYPNAVVVGTSVTVSCPACTAAPTGGTCSGPIVFRGNNNCMGSTTTVAADGACHAITPTSVSSFTYTPGPVSGASCAASYSKAPGTPAFAGVHNLCCR